MLWLILALVVGVALTLAFARRREARAGASHPPEGEMVTVEGVRVHMKVMGNGPDLVLIHGSSGNMRDFTLSLAPRLARHYRVFLVDRPGLGWSEPHPDGLTITGQARLLRQAVEAKGAVRPQVVGQSYGGAVALAWAVEAPDSLSALTLISSPAYPWDTGLGWYYTLTSHWLGRKVLIPLISAFVPDWYVRRELDSVFAPQPAPDGYSAHFGPDLTLRRGSLRANALQRRDLLTQIEALASRYDEITVPVEIVHGMADTIVGLSIHAERFAREHPGIAHLTPLPGIGHMPHHVAEDDVAAAIDRATLRARAK